MIKSACNHHPKHPGSPQNLAHGAGTGQHDCTTPGQFINLSLPGFYLRRPFSVCDWTDSSLTVYYKVVGQGTDAMTTLAPGTVLDASRAWATGLTKAKAAMPRC
jgi:hypothetical protein